MNYPIIQLMKSIWTELVNAPKPQQESKEMSWALMKCGKCGDRVHYNKDAVQAKKSSCPLSDCPIKVSNMNLIPDADPEEKKEKVPDGFYEAYAQPMLTTHIFDKKTKSRITFKEKKV